MKKIVLGLLLASIAGAASAADLAPIAKAPPLVSPAINWSGFYAGLFGGYGWSDQIRASVAGGGAAAVSSSDVNGGFGGGTLGYNWQAPGSQFVFGIEADVAGSDIADSMTIGAVTAREKVDAFGSVTGRVGVAFNQVLLYGKGGFAWGNNDISFAGPGGSISESHLHTGWTVGAGLEWMFAQSWSAKLEYQYFDFSKENYFAVAAPPGLDIGATFHTVKVGLNYHF